MEQQHTQTSSETFVLPGQTISHFDISRCKINRKYFTYEHDNLKPNNAGYLVTKSQEGNTIVNLYNNPKLYFPKVGDYVIGTIKFKSMDFYNLDINSSTEANLGSLQFNGATKRNKPNLDLGNVLFCQVTECEKFLAPKLSCITLEKKQWATGQTKLGQLKEGNIVYLSPNRIKYLEKIVDVFSKFTSFQIAIGRNGLVWINTKTTKNLIVLSNLVEMINKQNIDSILPNLGDLLQR